MNFSRKAFGSGISMFIATNVWRLAPRPSTVNVVLNLEGLSSLCSKRGFLPPECAKCDQIVCYCIGLSYGYVFPRLRYCPSSEIKEYSWSARLISNKVVLHFEHAHHFPFCTDYQAIFHFAGTSFDS